jgi:hypothetical protein
MLKNKDKKEILIFKIPENMDKKVITCYPYFQGTLFFKDNILRKKQEI